MSDDKIEREISSHNYDGITECDNPMPTWWIWTFLLTIIFSFLYFLHYEVAKGPTLSQELAAAMKEIEALKKHQPDLLETEETLAAAMADKELLTIGAQVYAAKCVACHGDSMQGLIGPNLVDSYWIHGKAKRLDIVKVIREGVAEKGMPSWGPAMSKQEIYATAAYIISRKGSFVQNAKAPQGELAP